MVQYSSDSILFVSLAMNQTLFYKALGDLLEQRGVHVVYICFHERSHEWLVAQGARSYNPFAMHPVRSEEVPLGELESGVLNTLLGHEKAAYEQNDSAKLLQKFRRHLHAMRQILGELILEGRKIELVQELGGFLSVLAAHFAAREQGMNSWFIEPSFFRGRVFFVPNSFRAMNIPGPRVGQATPAVEEYLRQATVLQATVIPAKDAHHYRGVGAKLIDRRHMRRLFEKFVDRYLIGKREEFQYPLGHARRHLRMWLNYFRQKKYYQPLEAADRFVYYPLHVPADFALTIRSPEYLDQFALIDFLCRTTPCGYHVAVKEHPALIGAAPYARLRDLMARHDNLVLLHPGINNYEVLRAAQAVVTVNSKSGAEGLLLGKPVIVLGDAFYGSSQLVHKVNALHELPVLLQELPRHPRGQDPQVIARYFQDVWNQSYAGELYDTRPENVVQFVDSLLARLRL